MSLIQISRQNGINSIWPIRALHTGKGLSRVMESVGGGQVNTPIKLLYGPTENMWA